VAEGDGGGSGAGDESDAGALERVWCPSVGDPLGCLVTEGTPSQLLLQTEGKRKVMREERECRRGPVVCVGVDSRPARACVGSVSSALGREKRAADDGEAEKTCAGGSGGAVLWRAWAASSAAATPLQTAHSRSHHDALMQTADH
jgi:hypothetical protein